MYEWLLKQSFLALSILSRKVCASNAHVVQGFTIVIDYSMSETQSCHELLSRKLQFCRKTVHISFVMSCKIESVNMVHFEKLSLIFHSELQIAKLPCILNSRILKVSR